MDTSYCVKCKRRTKNINSKGIVTKNKKTFSQIYV